MTADTPPLQDETVEMAEFVLGLLPEEEAMRLEALIVRDAALRDLHAEWQSALRPLLAARAVAPPAVLKGEIEAAIFGPLHRKAQARARLRWMALVTIPLVLFATANLLA